MRLKKPLLINIALGILVASSVLFFSQGGVFKRLQLSALDFSFRLRGAIPYNPRIIIVGITDEDILQIGRWPWKRVWHAALSEALTGLGAKYIYFDVIFSEASSDEDDKLFEEAIRQNKNIYLPFAFRDQTYDIKNAFHPLKRFSSYIKGTGAVNIYPDIDGTIRRIPLIFQGKAGIQPNVSLRIALDYRGLNIKDLKPNYLVLSDTKEEIKIPFVEENTMLINWAGRWQDTFKHYSYLDILAGYKDFLENKVPQINLDDFKNSICLVAVTAIGLYDIRPVPLQPEYPGIGVLANTINTILNKSFLRNVSGWIDILLLYLLALIPCFLIFGNRPFREIASVFLIGAIYFFINFLAFRTGLVLNLADHLLGICASTATIETYNFIRVAIERQGFFKTSVTDGLTELFNIRYFKVLLETEITMAKVDPNKRFVIVMSDIDHFKNFNDTYGHQVGDLVIKGVADILKTSVRTSDVVARYGGEEMIVLLRGTNLIDGIRIAEKIRKNIENAAIKDKQNTYKITASFGVSEFKLDDNVNNVIKRADDGLYKAKQSGRNRVATTEE